MRTACDFAANTEALRNRRHRAAAWTIAGLAVLLPAQAPGATKPPPAAPILVPIKKAHCHHMYGVVAERLKGRSAAVSTVTRNGLKDFFVIRPGVIDCKGERAIPWREGRDRDFIMSVLQATNAAFKKSKLDMSKNYGVGPAPAAAKPVAR